MVERKLANAIALLDELAVCDRSTLAELKAWRLIRRKLAHAIRTRGAVPPEFAAKGVGVL